MSAYRVQTLDVLHMLVQHQPQLIRQLSFQDSPSSRSRSERHDDALALSDTLPPCSMDRCRLDGSALR